MTQSRPTIEIHLFGTMQVLHNGQPITNFASRKAEALLAYLLLNPHPHPREMLADLLWDDRTQKQALGNLRVLLSNLRKLLPDLLLIKRQTVQINASVPISLDAALLQTALDLPGEDSLTAETAVSLANALETYRGVLLSGLHLRDARRFEAWLLMERERWQQIALRGLHKLAQYQFNHADLPAAEHTARRLVSIDPLREQAQQLLMRVLARQGNSNAALQQYQQLTALLAAELGVPPAPETERLYQRIRHARISTSFTLPPETNPLLGRQQEVAALQQQLNDRAKRLVTIVGIGGIGKTKLAVNVAHQRQEAYLHGICFISLATATDENSMLTLVAQALGVDLTGKVTLHTHVLDFLRNREMLLVLDNVEQITDVVTTWIRPLLQTAPDIQLLVTSRERLRLRGEWVLPLTGLAVEPSKTNQPGAGVQLLQQRAAQFAPDLPTDGEHEAAIQQICRLVDGVPLALELAAAGLAYHSQAQVVAALQENLDFLRTQLRDVPERHRSMRAVFAHSWQLLTLPEQQVFARLSVFRGGFTLAEAQAVAQADRFVLESLAAKSLVQRQANGRFTLHELLHQFAQEKLTAAAATAVRQQHAAYFAAYLQTHLAEMGAATPAALQAISHSFENIQAAWQELVQSKDETAVAHMLDGFAAYFYVRGLFHPGLTMLTQAQAAFAHASPRLQAHLRVRQALFLGEIGDYAEAVVAADEAVAWVDESETAVVAIADLCRGYAQWSQGEYDTAKTHLQHAVNQAKAISLQWVEAQSLNTLGNVLLDQGDPTAAQAAHSQAFAIASAGGHQRIEASAHINLGNDYWHMGDFTSAHQQFEQALHICQSVGIRQIESLAHLNIGLVDSELGRHAESVAHIERALAISREVGDRRGEGNALLNLLVIYMEQYQFGKANELLPDALAVCRAVGDRQGEAMALDIEAHIYLLTGEFAKAEQVLAQIWQLCERIGDSWGLMETCFSQGQLYWQMGDFAAGVARTEDGLTRARALSDQTNEAKGLNILGHGRFAQHDYADALSAYEQAIQLWQAVGQPHLTLESETGRLLCLHRLQRPLPSQVIDKCVQQLLEQPLHGLTEPGWALYAGYLLLAENSDERADLVRERGVRFLRETAVQFPHPRQQTGYYHKIRHHHALLTDQPSSDAGEIGSV